MAYDFHGKWERETGHNAPLYASSLDSEWQKQLSVDNAASMWVRLGAPKEKMIIGMPTYGRSFTLSNPANFKVHAAASGGGKAGEYTKESGFLAYYEVSSFSPTLAHGNDPSSLRIHLFLHPTP
jgi:chitinase